MNPPQGQWNTDQQQLMPRSTFSVAGWLDSLASDFRFALRSLNKDLRFTAVAVFALALGIGASTVVFSVFYHLVVNPFSARDSDRLAVPSIEKSGQEIFPLTRSLETFEAIREQNRSFEDLVAYTHSFVHVSDGHEQRQFYVGYVTANAFSFYGVPPLLGRGITEEDGAPGAPPVFVISYKTWHGEFNGDPTILGKTFIVDGEPRTLIGIMPPRFQAYGATVAAWIPFDVHDPAFAAQGPTLFLIGRLKPGVSFGAAGKDLELVLGRLAKIHPQEFPERFTVRVQSAADYFLGPWGIGSAGASEFGLKHLLYNLLAAVLMLLLIACCNVANLLLARATVREREIAVRAALGASRGRVVRQLLVESLTLALAACAMGCLFAYFGTKAASMFVPEKGIGIGGEAAIHLDLTALLFALGITVLTTLLCGLAPALHAAYRDLQPQLAGGGKGAGKTLRHGRLRASLVIGEVALSIVLLVGAGLMIRSFFVVTHIDLGFDPRNLVMAPLGTPSGRYDTPEQNKNFVKKVLQSLSTLPGVAEVAVNNSLPGYNGGFESMVATSGEDYTDRAKFEGCSEELVRVLNLRLLAGRWLSQREVASAQHVAVINQTMARKFFGSEDPVGRQIRLKAFAERPGTPQSAVFQVIGVVGDIKNNGGPEQPAMAGAFIPYTIEGGSVFLIRTKTAPAPMLHAIQERVWAVDRDVIFADFEPLEETLYRLTYSAPEFGLATLSFLASIAILLVMIGVFSVMAYTVSLRTREIGIRMALGAVRGDIVRMVVKNGCLMIAAGTAIGLLASWGLTRFLASQVWGISVTDPLTFVAVVAGIVAAGIVACLAPARRAARVDPLVALRCE